MGKVIVPMVFAMFVGILLFAGALSSAETVSFNQSTTVGNMSNSALDIVNIGAYASDGYQYFKVETRSAGIDAPPDGDTYSLSVVVDAKYNGEEDEQYLLILLSWTNGGGTVTHFYRYSVENTGSTDMAPGDVVVSGTQITVRVPSSIMTSAEVKSVKFITVDYTTQSSDVVTYTVQSGGGGGSDNGGTSNSTVPDDTGWFAFLGLGLGLACLAIIFIIWIVLAIWAYKDAKKRGMDSPIIWFLVVFFLGIIGLIIYLIVRPKEVPQNTNVPPPPPPQ